MWEWASDWVLESEWAREWALACWGGPRRWEQEFGWRPTAWGDWLAYISRTEVGVGVASCGVQTLRLGRWRRSWVGRRHRSRISILAR